MIKIGWSHWLVMVAFATFFPPRVWSTPPINSWTNAGSAHWEESFWSLGTLPNSSQSVAITNAGFKSVGIFPTTATDFPTSLTIDSLSIEGPTNGFNTLLLNFSGTSTPLHTLDGVLIGTNGMLANFYSGIQVDGTNGGGLVLQSGKLIEEGGTLTASNTMTLVLAGSMNLTNAIGNFWVMLLDSTDTFDTTNLGTVTQSGGQVTGALSIRNGAYNLIDGDFFGTYSGINQSGRFSQYSGTNFATISLGYSAFFGVAGYGTYNLYGGTVMSPSIVVGNHAYTGGEFDQGGGTVRAGAITLGGGTFGSGFYWLTNGNVFAGTLMVFDGFIQQMDGQLTTTNGLTLLGSANRTAPEFASYTLSGGNVTSPSLDIDYGSFTQSGGTNSIAQKLSFANSTYTLSGGTLLSSNTIISFGTFIQGGTGERTVSKFLQSGGQHHVAGTLTDGDEYIFSGGSLSANKIILSGTLIISNGAVITSPGLFTLAGKLQIYGAATENFGPMLLSFFSTIDLEQGSHTLTFADSSGGTPWSSGQSMLTITNWNGSPNGGGSDRVIFGNNAAGLTSSQLALIRFSNPAGFLPGIYPARILSTGEIVPATTLPPLAYSRSENNLIVTWAGGFVLQTSTNILGPFTDAIGATSPYTNLDNQSPGRFFRLRN
jgi:hypothetical protein